MKFASRLLPLLAAGWMIAGMAIAPSVAQIAPSPAPAAAAADPSASSEPKSPNPKYDAVFAKVKGMEETALSRDVLNEYASLKKEYANKDPEIAAEALWRGVLYASDPNRYGRGDLRQLRKDLQVEPDAMPEQVKDRIKALAIEGDTQAHTSIKQLFQEFPNSVAAQVARRKIYSGVDFQTMLEQRMDHRNSANATYKLVDSLVAMTGRNPAFSYWFALALIAIIVKLITMPLTLKMYKSQREMQRIQPLMKDLQEQYKGKPELNQKMMDFYKEHGVSPFASCFPMLIQIPFMIWVYNMIRQYEYHFAYGHFLWIGAPISHRYPQFLAGNLAQFDMVLLVVYSLSTYLTTKLTPAADPASAQQQKTMSIMMTGMMFYMFMLYKWSSAFMFYWLVLNLISAYQQYYYIYKGNINTLVSPPPGKGAVKSPYNNGASGGTGSKPQNNGATPAGRPVTTPAGADAMRPRPRRKKR